jgi:hypothetical protein
LKENSLIKMIKAHKDSDFFNYVIKFSSPISLIPEMLCIKMDFKRTDAKRLVK